MMILGKKIDSRVRAISLAEDNSLISYSFTVNDCDYWIPTGEDIPRKLLLFADDFCLELGYTRGDSEYFKALVESYRQKREIWIKGKHKEFTDKKGKPAYKAQGRIFIDGQTAYSFNVRKSSESQIGILNHNKAHTIFIEFPVNP